MGWRGCEQLDKDAGQRAVHTEMVVTVGPSSSSKSHAPEDYQVLLGSTRLYQHTQHTRKMSVSRIITHPDFEKFHPFGNDIAMLQLHVPVNFTSYISPTCLPTPAMQMPSHLSCWITGWRMLSEESEGVWEGRHESREREEGEQGEDKEERGGMRGGTAQPERSPGKEAPGPWPSMPHFQRTGAV